MTQNRKTIALVCATILGLAVCFLIGSQIRAAVLTAIAQPSTGTFQQQAAPVPIVVHTPQPVTAVADQLIARTLGDTDYTTEQADQVNLTADRVCEGMTAGVPLVVLEPELARETGMTGVAAHQFVKDVVELRCPTA